VLVNNALVNNVLVDDALVNGVLVMDSVLVTDSVLAAARGLVLTVYGAARAGDVRLRPDA
jgi:hypothetical protein